VAQCTHEVEVRAVARAAEDIEGLVRFQDLVGNGRLSVTIESEERAARYQGIVALESGSLADCIESYFATSEQLPTRLVLAADAETAGGVLLQKMPAANAQGEAGAALSQQAWETMQSRLEQIEVAQWRRDPPEELLPVIAGEFDLRLFAATAVRFTCRCSQARVAGLLRSLGPEELHDILAEQGAVTVTCEFCGRPYRFDSIDVEQLFSGGASPDTPHSLN
jgi:molecular chaperone Hsp33